MPVYLLITDLAFAAMFTVCAKLTRLGLLGVIHFFLLYLPLIWVRGVPRSLPPIATDYRRSLPVLPP